MQSNVVVLALKVLKTLTNSGKCFTAFDITKLVRAETKEYVAHDEVKDLVHQLFEQDFFNGFVRQPHTFISDGTRVTAQLFIPPNGNPFLYNPDEIKAVSFKDEPDLDPADTLLEDDKDDECCGGGCHVRIVDQSQAQEPVVLRSRPPKISEAARQQAREFAKELEELEKQEEGRRHPTDDLSPQELENLQKQKEDRFFSSTDALPPKEEPTPKGIISSFINNLFKL